jgi:hypothetical protein
MGVGYPRSPRPEQAPCFSATRRGGASPSAGPVNPRRLPAGAALSPASPEAISQPEGTERRQGGDW